MGAEHDAGPSMAIAIHGPISLADLPGLCDRFGALLRESQARVVRCDVHGVDADVVTVDALARLQLVAKRRRCRFLLVGTSPPLRELVGLMGLDDVLLET